MSVLAIIILMLLFSQVNHLVVATIQEIVFTYLLVRVHQIVVVKSADALIY